MNANNKLDLLNKTIKHSAGKNTNTNTNTNTSGESLNSEEKNSLNFGNMNTSISNGANSNLNSLMKPSFPAEGNVNVSAANMFNANNFATSLLSQEQLLQVQLTQNRLENEARLASQLSFQTYIQASFDPAVATLQAENVYRNKLSLGQSLLQAELSKLYQHQIQKLLMQLAPSKSNATGKEAKTSEDNKRDSTTNVQNSKNKKAQTTTTLSAQVKGTRTKEEKSTTASDIAKTDASVEGRINKNKMEKKINNSAEEKQNDKNVKKAKISGEEKEKENETKWTAKRLVGKRVQIEWETTWYAAQVQSYSEKTGICTVLYDTGSPETVIFQENGKATSPDGEDEFQWKPDDNSSKNKQKNDKNNNKNNNDIVVKDNLVKAQNNENKETTKRPRMELGDENTDKNNTIVMDVSKSVKRPKVTAKSDS